MKTTLNVNGHGEKLIEAFEKASGKKLPPSLIGYVHPKTRLHTLTNNVAQFVFRIRLYLWAKSVMREYKKWLRRAEKIKIPPTL